MRVFSFIETIMCFTAAVACGEEVAPKVADTLQPITLKQSELSGEMLIFTEFVDPTGIATYVHLLDLGKAEEDELVSDCFAGQ